MSSDKLICVGRIKAAHGVKGEVKIHSYTDSSENITQFNKLTNSTGSQSFLFEYRGFAGQYLIASIEGIDNRTSAEALKGTKLYISREMLPPVDEDEFYYEDLFGLIAETENGDTIGTVKAIHNFGAGDILEVALSGSEETTEMYPFTKDIVPIIDIPNNKLVISLPDVTFVKDDK